MRPIRSLLAIVAFFAALTAAATPQSRNATDLWITPGESGWGLNVIHQGNTLFTSLFVYGQDSQPKWYFASGMVGDGQSFSGPLFETTGPFYGGAFDPRAVQTRQVGTMAFVLGAQGASLEYTVDGVRVAKQLVRYTFRKTSLQGQYEGTIVQPAAGGAAEVARTGLSILIGDDGTAFSMDTSSDSESACTWSGTPAQDGQIESVAGTFRCASGTGSWSMAADPTPEGFTGTFSGNGITGRIAAARRGLPRMQGNGWRNDLWYVPSEAGWGLNVIEQGDTLFASLFVYDAQGRPHWYSASDLRLLGDVVDGDVTFSGDLTESTGPYFGAPFNAAAVTRRTVGTMSLHTRPADGTAELSYTVDGRQVVKQLQRDTFAREDFSGSYLGSFAHDREATIAIEDGGATFTMQLVDRFGGAGTCTFTAPWFQTGMQRTMSGTFTCSGGRSGPFLMRNATVSAQGFTARFDAPALDPDLSGGHIEGARR